MSSRRLLLLISVHSVVIFNVLGDVYLHNPRGSNNRLNEASAARNNANRLFDSQNNNRGGYNVGDKLNEAATSSEEQYQMKFFQSSANVEQGRGRTFLTVEWTNQHGCGGDANTDPHQLNCEIVLQYMCKEGANQEFRDGTSTGTASYSEADAAGTSRVDAIARKAADASPTTGVHEQWEWYDKCASRERNKGLFTADQALQKDTAIATRQNPDGERQGYECPEERDYWPYWHPSPWKDIAVFTDNLTLCSEYESNSFNVAPKHECIETYADDPTFIKHNSQWNTEESCSANGGDWIALHNYLEKAVEYTSRSDCEEAPNRKWAIPYDAVQLEKECLVTLPRPECLRSPWTRVNHLGTADTTGRLASYTWALPHFPSEKEQKCVFRIRYNISTGDYDPFNTDHTMNGDNSPIQDDPEVDVGFGVNLQLAIDTDQFGRTFQDRSHIFVLRPRPASAADVDIYNLNIRGKRGNPIQTYPAVPYDFSPSQLRLTSADAVHVQWTGSNTHNNGQNAGDGLAGTDGLGSGGFDRHNLVEVKSTMDNYPTSFTETIFWSNANVLWLPGHVNSEQMTPKSLAAYFASSGYYHGYQCDDQCASSKSPALDPSLDNAPASFEGAVLQLKPGNYSFMASRNNAVSRRSQKGSILVDSAPAAMDSRSKQLSRLADLLLRLADD